MLVRDPEDRLPSVRPTLHPSRELFYQDHLVRAQRRAEIAVEALRFAESILQPRQMPRAGMHLVRAVGGNDACPLFWTEYLQFRTACRSPDTATLARLLKKGSEICALCSTEAGKEVAMRGDDEICGSFFSYIDLEKRFGRIIRCG